MTESPQAIIDRCSQALAYEIVAVNTPQMASNAFPSEFEIAEAWEMLDDSARATMRRLVCTVIRNIPTPGRDDAEAMKANQAIQAMIAMQPSTGKDDTRAANIIDYVKRLG